MAANPTLLSMPIAENGTKNTIPETQATPGNGLMSQSTGFPAECSLPLGAGGVAPDRADFNGAFYLLGGVAFMAQKGFTFNYDATQDYYKGCVVIDNGNRYLCIADMTAGTVAPSADTAHDYWIFYPVGVINKRDVITTSGTYTAPVTGWYKITAKGGGGGGAGGISAVRLSSGANLGQGGGGGGEGGTTIAYEYMIAGDTATVVIGAGGTGGSAVTTSTGNSGAAGGNTTVTINNNSYIGYGGGAGTSDGANGGGGTIQGCPGGAGKLNTFSATSAIQNGEAGGGQGGGFPAHNGAYGGGGGGGYSGSSLATTSAGGKGGNGFVWFEYFELS